MTSKRQVSKYIWFAALCGAWSSWSNTVMSEHPILARHSTTADAMAPRQRPYGNVRSPGIHLSGARR